MLKKTLFFVLFSFATLLQAETEGYQTLSPAQPTQSQDKIEVIEFFWYGCPHCYALEPYINKWLENKPENVEFIRQPAAFSATWTAHARAFLIAQALGVGDKVHADFFDVIQNKKQKLTSEDELAQFFIERGVTEAEFRKAYDSFFVKTKLEQAKAKAPRYGLTGVPALIVNGKYKITGSLAGSHENMIKVLEQLIEKEAKAKVAQ